MEPIEILIDESRIIDMLLSIYGISRTSTTFLVLNELIYNQPRSMYELCKNTHKKSGTIVPLLRRLEEKGIIYIVKDENNGRIRRKPVIRPIKVVVEYGGLA